LTKLFLSETGETAQISDKEIIKTIWTCYPANEACIVRIRGLRDAFHLHKCNSHLSFLLLNFIPNVDCI